MLSRVNVDASNYSAIIRTKPEDFQVEEYLPFKPDGTGGHVWLQIRKRNTNTDWLATTLAKFAGVPPVSVGYAGMKDRHAVTTQWFSVNLEGHSEPEWFQFNNDEIEILTITRHGKKLKRGVLSGNKFTLLLRNLKGEPVDIEVALNQIKQAGVPNYFGEQRFGHGGNNLEQAERWFRTGRAPKSRNKRSMYLSAARSWLFNLVLTERINSRNWNEAVAGDVMLLDGTRASHFVADQVDNDILKRMVKMDIHPSGPLWGRGESYALTQVAEIESQVLDLWHPWCQELEKQGLKQERRALRVVPKNFEWQFLENKQLKLTFSLPPGCYATTILRELAVIVDYHQRNFIVPSPIRVVDNTE